MDSMKLFFLLCAYASADVYMHNPRGSNDRNCERNVNRNNGNRLFDSQNNAKGGYACGRKVGGNAVNDQTPQMEFWEGSKLAIKWTAQHGTGALDTTTKGKAEDTSDSEIIIQYACSDTLDPTKKYNPTNQALEHQGTPRDGIPANDNDAATDRPGTNDNRGGNGANSYQDATQNRFGIHETAEAYNDCNRVSRNKGLFTADQNVNRRSAIGTRQNPNGGRRGLECPEERDYYPYWRPSPFVDVAALVTSGERCGDANMKVGQWCRACKPGSNNLPANPATAGMGGTNAAGEPCCSEAKKADQSYAVRDTVMESQNIVPKGFCELPYNNNQVLTAPTTAAAGESTVYYKGKTKLQASQRAYARREWPISETMCKDIGQKWSLAKLSRHNVVGGAGAKTANIQVGTNDAALDGPICKKSEFSRPNHLGNGQTPTGATLTGIVSAPGNGEKSIEVGYAAQANTFVWTIPKFTAEQHASYDKVGNNIAKAMPCVVRLRYNMSTSDFARGLDAGTINNETPKGSNNGALSPIKQDPYIDIGTDGTKATGETKSQLLALAVNTNQMSRTFQDRSYVFKVRAVAGAANIAAMKDGGDCENGVWNMNVQGKRGNIVQVYPSVEYNWVPQSACVAPKTCLHFQVTGSGYNPRRGCNDGQGGPPDKNTGASSNQNARADRSNLVEQLNFMDQYPLVPTNQDKAGISAYLNVKVGSGNQVSFFGSGAEGTRRAYRFGFLDQEAQLAGKSITPTGAYQNGGDTAGGPTDDMWEGSTYFYERNQARQGCLTQGEIQNLQKGNRRETHPRNCAYLNAAMQPYQNLGIVKIGAAGMDHKEGDKYALYSTRNNNFSNREQQLAISVGRMEGDKFKCNEKGTGDEVTSSVPPVVDLGAEPAIAQSEQEKIEEELLEKDLEGYDPVENDGTGDGIKVGCTSLMAGMNGSSSLKISFATSAILMVLSMIFLN